MILLIRFVLVLLIIYLIIRSFTRYIDIERGGSKNSGQDIRNTPDKKKISKEVGEIIDYEEVDK